MWFIRLVRYWLKTSVLCGWNGGNFWLIRPTRTERWWSDPSGLLTLWNLNKVGTALQTAFQIHFQISLNAVPRLKIASGNDLVPTGIKPLASMGNDGPVHWRICVIGHQCINSCPPEQNGRHFADDVFRCIFMNEKFSILNKISLKIVAKGPIDNNPALVQIMAWRRTGDKPLSETMLTQFIDAFMRH